MSRMICEHLAFFRLLQKSTITNSNRIGGSHFWADRPHKFLLPAAGDERVICAVHSLRRWHKEVDIKRLTYALKKQELTSFLFVLCAHNILLDFFVTTHSLPKIARGSIDPFTVLKGCHSLELFELYQMCDELSSPLPWASAKQKLSDLCDKIFNIRPFRSINFKIECYEVLSRNKNKFFCTSF